MCANEKLDIMFLGLHIGRSATNFVATGMRRAAKLARLFNVHHLFSFKNLDDLKGAVQRINDAQIPFDVIMADIGEYCCGNCRFELMIIFVCRLYG